MSEKLTDTQETELIDWIETFELSRPSKRLGRDFSDGVLLAEILKSIFPKMVDLHNYSGCSSVQQKINNWVTLERKVLRKINVFLNDATILKLSEANTEVVKVVLFEVKQKSKIALESKNSNTSNGSHDSQLSEIMTINIEQRIGDQIEITPQKMIFYNLYEKLEQVLSEKTQVVKILQQKNDHLENLLKLKNERIEDLESRLKRKDKNILQQISMDFVANNDEVE